MKYISILLAILFLTVPLKSQNVVINEIMSLNTDAFSDEDGEFPDWLELYNSGDTPLDITGYGLSDDPDEPLKWILPMTIINPYQFITVFASDKDRGLWANHIETIIDRGDTWKYRLGDSEPPGSWYQINFDDNTWLSGHSGFGFGDGDDATQVPQVVSVYVRKDFYINDSDSITGALLHVDYDDGFVAYLNGWEVARANIGAVGTPPAYNETANNDHEALIYQGLPPELFAIYDATERFVEGKNVLAIQVHNMDSFSSDLTLIPFFSLGMFEEPNNATGIPEILRSNLPAYHTNFKIASEGELLTLADTNGDIIDQVDSTEIQRNISFGRYPDGADDWGFFTEPTPGGPNSSHGSSSSSRSPDFSTPAGLYPNSISVSLSSPSQNAAIYYTLDNSLPDSQSQVFDDPIELNTTTVIRAIAYDPGYLPSKIETRSYIIDYSPGLPIVSLSTDPPNFFDEDTGIYVLGTDYDPDPPNRGANFWEDWERPIHLELFEADGTFGFRANAGVKIHGGWTRFFPQKSLALYARRQYGDNIFNYKLFPDLDIDKFESFILRNSGSDWDHTMFRDAFMVSLMEDVDLDIQAYRPAVVFINGDYWGIQNIREKKNEHFFASHYGIDPDSVDMMDVWGNVSNGDDTHYTNMMDFFNANDISDSDNYTYVSTLIDVDNFINWNITHIYIDNTDWPGNNNEFWRPHRPGGKWRWILFDTDFGFGLHGSETYRNNTMEYAVNDDGDDWPNPAYATFLLRKMLENADFRNKFVSRFDDFLNINFESVHVHERINQIRSGIDSEIQAHLQRWDREFDRWSDQVEELHEFAEARPAYMRSYIQQYFHLSGSSNVTINVNPPNMGVIKINSKTISGYPWSGTYFNDVPIEFTAIPSDGVWYQFSHWSGSLGSSEPFVSTILHGDVNITAVFEERSYDTTGIVINEINYNSAADFDTEDWIELYAVSGDHNLSGYILGDDTSSNRFVLPEETFINEGDYLLVVRDSADFVTFFPDATNLVGELSFKLNNTGDMVQLFDPRGILINSVTYSDTLPWPLEADGLGPTLERIDPTQPNDSAQYWRASHLSHGSPGRSNIYHRPEAFGLASPANNSVVDSDTVEVKWTASMDIDEGDSVYYRVEWSLDADFTILLSALTADTSYLITYYQMLQTDGVIRQLRSAYGRNSIKGNNQVIASIDMINESDDSLPVYWRVTAIDRIGSETIADPGISGWSFNANIKVNNPPSAFSLLSPDNDSVINSDTVLVKWSSSMDTDEGDSIYYRLEWALDANFLLLSEALTADTSYLIVNYPTPSTDRVTRQLRSVSGRNNIKGNNGKIASKDMVSESGETRTVYWRVTCIDRLGAVTIAYPGMSGWSFTTDVQVNNPPSSFFLLSPNNGSVVNNDAVKVIWSSSIDPDSADTVRYQVEWSLNASYLPSMQETTGDTFMHIIRDPSIQSMLISGSKTSKNTFTRIGYYSTDALPDSHEVYWRVKAVDTQNLETPAFPGASGWYFRVLLPPVDPPIPVPEEFKVDFAYPNPFNSHFTIPIEMDQDGGNVSIKMWNLLGHVVFENKLTLAAGYHRYLINDANSEIRFPAGVYILKVTHADYAHQQKIVLMK